GFSSLRDVSFVEQPLKAIAISMGMRIRFIAVDLQSRVPTQDAKDRLPLRHRDRSVGLRQADAVQIEGRTHAIRHFHRRRESHLDSAETETTSFRRISLPF